MKKSFFLLLFSIFCIAVFSTNAQDDNLPTSPDASEGNRSLRDLLGGIIDEQKNKLKSDLEKERLRKIEEAKKKDSATRFISKKINRRAPLNKIKIILYREI